MLLRGRGVDHVPKRLLIWTIEIYPDGNFTFKSKPYICVILDLVEFDCYPASADQAVDLNRSHRVDELPDETIRSDNA